MSPRERVHLQEVNHANKLETADQENYLSQLLSFIYTIYINPK